MSGERERQDVALLLDNRRIAGDCPASMEAVVEEEFGPGDGCPLCGAPAADHRPEEDE